MSNKSRELLVPGLHHVVCPVHVEVAALIGIHVDGGNLARPVPEAVVSPWIQVVWKYARRSSMSRPIGISSRIWDLIWDLINCFHTKRLHCETNNLVESWNRKFSDLANPTIFKFIAAVQIGESSA